MRTTGVRAVRREVETLHGGSRVDREASTSTLCCSVEERSPDYVPWDWQAACWVKLIGTETLCV